MFEVTYICTIIKTTSVGDQLAGDTDGLAGDSGRGQSGRGQPDRSRRWAVQVHVFTLHTG